MCFHLPLMPSMATVGSYQRIGAKQDCTPAVIASIRGFVARLLHGSEASGLLSSASSEFGTAFDV
jgi:hypothetical protein